MIVVGSIDFEFCSSPVSAFGVVPDLVISFVAEPVGQWSVLSLLLGQPFLHKQRFVRSHLWIQILPKIINQSNTLPLSFSSCPGQFFLSVQPNITIIIMHSSKVNQSKKSPEVLFNSRMSIEQRSEYKQLFQLFAQFDINGNGSISVEEWRQAMRRFGHEATEEQTHDMMLESGIPFKSEITLFEFITLITNKKKEMMGQEHAELAKAFRLFDKDVDGVLNARELQAGLQRFGETMKLEDLELLVSMADRDHDGSINFQQFSRIMTLK